jgi:3-oxoacyl-[acyl-carrier protein] reductase
MEIYGKSALVSGAASGIGRATARALVLRGVRRIVIADIDGEKLVSLADEIRKLGAEAVTKRIDLRDVEAVKNLYCESDARMEGLDIVYNNAGVMSGPPDFPDSDVDKMIAAIQINLIAMIVGTRLTIGHLRRRGRAGVIVNASSMAAFSHLPHDPAYTASKHGILAFCQSCKPLKEQFGIRVIAICPGITDTAIVQRDAEWLKPALSMIRILTAEEVANEVCRIVEDDHLAGDHVMLENSPATD